MTLQSHLTFLGFKMVIFSVKWGNSSVQHISLNFENWIRKTLTRLESSWFNWQRLVISKSNRFSLLISQLWLNSRGSRDYKYHDNRTSNQIPLSESQAEHYLYDYLGVVTISGKSDFDNYTFILLKNFVQRYWRWPQNWPLPTCWWDYWSIMLPFCPYYIIVSRKEPEFSAIHGHFRKYHIRNSF